MLIMEKSVFYHAGCPVCVSAEQDLINLIGRDKIDIVHFGQDKSRIEEAERAGVESVPALVTRQGHVLHINCGASMEEVKGYRLDCPYFERYGQSPFIDQIEMK